MGKVKRAWEDEYHMTQMAKIEKVTADNQDKIKELMDAGLNEKHLDAYLEVQQIMENNKKFAAEDGSVTAVVPEVEYPRLYIKDPHKEDTEQFKKVTAEMNALYSKKNRDYGGSFDESLDEDGLLVSKIRLGDKYRRFSQLLNKNPLVHDESIRDTLIDMANYAAMTVKWMDKKAEEAKEMEGKLW